MPDPRDEIAAAARSAAHLPLRAARRLFEAQMLAAYMIATDHRPYAAARLAGIEPPTFYRALRSHGLWPWRNRKDQEEPDG